MQRFFVILPLLLSLTGCSFFAFGKGEKVWVNSNPSHALVRFSTGEMCYTPCEMLYGNREEFSITVAKPGYKPVTVPISTRFSGKRSLTMLGDIPGGPVAGVGDLASGGTRMFSPNPIDVWLEPITPWNSEGLRNITEEPMPDTRLLPFRPVDPVER
jgi:hypothetical protein